MLDVSRDYITMPALKELINLLAFTKVNVFHLHLSDDDSMNVQLPSYPTITDYTALKQGQIYTAQDLRDIAQLCDQLGIKLIPEIDIPGHSLAFSKFPLFSDYILCKDPGSRHKMFDGQYIKGGPGSATWNPG